MAECVAMAKCFRDMVLQHCKTAKSFENTEL